MQSTLVMVKYPAGHHEHFEAPGFDTAPERENWVC